MHETSGEMPADLGSNLRLTRGLQIHENAICSLPTLAIGFVTFLMFLIDVS